MSITSVSTPDSSSVLHYIEALERKQDKYMEMLDKTYTGHITSIESKLDQLVDLTRTVAQLQVQQSSHSSEITDVKVSFKDLINNNRDTVDRIHTRLDTLTNKMVDVSSSNQKIVNDMEASLEEVHLKINTWQNRFIGGVAVAALLLGLIQWLTVDYLGSIKSSIETNRTELAAKIISLETKVTRE